MTTINLKEGRAQTKTSGWRARMLSLFGRWITTTINIFVRSQHSSFHYSTSYPCCPSKGIFPSSDVQTLVSLSGNNWSVGWSCYPASLCNVLDVHSLRTLEPLSIYKGCCFHNKLRLKWGVFVDCSGYKRGQASRVVVGAKISTNCHFEAHTYRFSYLLGYI